MKNTVIHMMEMIVGAIILALGLFYLGKQDEDLNHLVNAVTGRILGTDNLKQDFNLIDLRQISDEALYAIVMGYREYPITIDGVLIKEDENEYEYYFTLIKDGYYNKNYEYEDGSHRIKQVNFIHTGL